MNAQLKKTQFFEEKKIQFPEMKRNSTTFAGIAAQVMWFKNILPFALINCGVSVFNDKCWQMILCLRQKIMILESFKLSIGQVALLQSLIKEYIYLRAQNFPDEKLKPKHHFLMHYAYFIRQFRCFCYVRTLRFESKHQYFKELIRRMK